MTQPESLKAVLTQAAKVALKEKQKDRLSVIRMALAAIKQVEVDERIDVSDERALAILDRMVKQRREAERQFRDAGRVDLADKEAGEIQVIQDFLPKALSDEEIKPVIAAAIQETGAQSARDMGKVMAILKPQLQGKADLSQVSAKVKAQLASL